MLFLCKSGANLAFGFIFSMHLENFPPAFMVTSFGICNFFCRLITMGAPVVAELPNKMIPLSSMVIVNFLAVFASILMRPRSK